MRVLFIALMFLTQSQGPTPTPSKTGQSEQPSTDHKAQQANPKQVPPETALTINGQIVTQAGENGRRKKEAESSTDWWLVIFTAALVVVAAFQYWAMHRQAAYMRRGLRISVRAARASKQSADAAKRNAEFAEKSLVQLNRAYLTVDWWSDQSREQDTLFWVSFRIFNPSHTAARVETIEAKFGNSTTVQDCRNILTPQEGFMVRIATERTERMFMRIVGRITYTDIFRRERHRKFAKDFVFKDGAAKFETLGNREQTTRKNGIRIRSRHMPVTASILA